MNEFVRAWYSIPGVFLAGRLILLLSLPLEGLTGYGDYWNFFGQARLGIPFFDYWTEFPPVFPFLSSLIYSLASGREHTYQIMLAIILSIFQSGVVALFVLLSERLLPPQEAGRRAWVFALLTIGLTYTWWYFDVISVFFMLLGVYWLLSGNNLRAGISAGAGALVKWFPLLLVVIPWRFSDRKSAVRFSLVTTTLILIPWLVLYAVSPSLTRASILSQFIKGPWETVWALLSGFITTGNFGPGVDRTDPEGLLSLDGGGGLVSPLVTLPIFLAVGFALFRKANRFSDRSAIGFLGLTWCLFLLWSPGYSPQWVLYLLPIILLVLPERIGILMTLVLLGVNLLEWPVLLSRGLFSTLWLIIPLRTGLLIVLAAEFWRICRIIPMKEAKIDVPA